MADTKKCNVCEEVRPIKDYWKDNTKPDGRDYTCKHCRNKRRKKHKPRPEWSKEKKRKGDRERMREYYKTEEGRQYRREIESKWYYKPENVKARLKERLLSNMSSVVYFRQCEDCMRVDVGRSEFSSSKCFPCSMKGPIKLREVSCIICGVKYMGKNERARCYECRDKLDKECRREYKRKRRKLTGNHRKRARYYGVPYEPVNRLKVFKRDKWKCKHCGIKVQSKVIHQPNTAHLDHIVPMSKGGPHTYTNVQTLCRNCNIIKGDSMPEQLLLRI